MSMSTRYLSSNNTSVNELIPVFTKYLVLDVISDPFHLSRNLIQDKTNLESREVIINGEKKVINAAEARMLYWENNFGLTIEEKYRNRVLPRNTIIGRPYDFRTESPISGSGAFFLFPIFPSNFSQPIKPGESVWVLHESNRSEHNNKGWWISKFVEFGEADDPNFSLATRGLERNSSSPLSFTSGIKNEDGTTDTTKCPVQTGDDGPNFLEKTSTQTLAAKETIKEAIPRFKGRTSDFILEGSNNTLIVMGTDRTSSSIDLKKSDSYALDVVEKKENHKTDSLIPETDFKEGAGSIDIVVGRGQTEKTKGNTVSVESSTLLDPSTQKPIKLGEEIKKTPDLSQENEGDPDWKNDKSRVLLAQRTKVDFNLGLQEFNAKLEIPDDENGDGAVIIKSDKIRMIARKDIEILVEGSNGPAAIVINSKGDIIIKPSGTGVVKLGGEDANLAVLCNKAINVNGTVTSTLIADNWGGTNGAGEGNGQWATKVLLK